MTSLGVLHQSSDMKLIDVNGASLFTYKTSSPDGSQCLAQVSEVLDFWKKLFPSLTSALSPVTLASYSTASPCEGTYVRDVAKESTLNSAPFIPLDAVLYFICSTHISSNEKVHLAKLLLYSTESLLHNPSKVELELQQLSHDKNIGDMESMNSFKSSSVSVSHARLDKSRRKRGDDEGMQKTHDILEPEGKKPKTSKSSNAEVVRLNRKVKSLGNKVESLTNKLTGKIKTRNGRNRANELCEFGDCRTYASFNFKGEAKVKYCKAHKQNGMINITDKLCEQEGCEKSATYNYKNQGGYRFCRTHKLEGMIIPFTKSCGNVGCLKRALFNYPNETSVLYCGTHKLPEMINKYAKRCERPGCNVRASFNIVGVRGVRYCFSHKPVDAVRSMK